MIFLLSFPDTVELLFHHLTVGEQPIVLEPQMPAILDSIPEIFPKRFAIMLLHLVFQVVYPGFHLAFVVVFFDLEPAVITPPFSHFQKNPKQVRKVYSGSRGPGTQIMDALAFVRGNGGRIETQPAGKVRDVFQPAGAALVQPALLAGQTTVGFLEFADTPLFGREQGLVENTHRVPNWLHGAAFLVQFQRHQSNR